MINSVQLKNFGPLTELDWQNLGPINLVIGNNGCGKSFLLKAIYSAVRTLEIYKRGNNPNSAADILFDKLYWTFQTKKLGDLVSKSAEAPLSFCVNIDQQNFSYSFGKDTSKAINSLENLAEPRGSSSIYLPSKESLSLHHIILSSREHNQVFGFDDTYFDLAKALQTSFYSININLSISSSAGTSAKTVHADQTVKRECSFEIERDKLEDMLDGRIEFDESEKCWYFKKGRQRFDIGVTAEGIKKVAILDTLLSNGYLNGNSIVFIDEPESALHPDAISKLLDIIALLAKHGIQFFIASHSYAVVKKLYLIAQQQNISIPVLSREGDDWVQSDLLDDFPDNPIIDESIRLYEQEVELAFK
ncbi:MAG: ATPase [Methylomonas sp.]|nr:MAG: ATPase [Methylomonas sp.]